MSIDKFATELFEEAKRFLEKFNDSQSHIAYLHAALFLGISSLEAHVNSICSEFSIVENLSTYEAALLCETSVELKDGQFLMGGEKFYRLEDRILFLCRRFSTNPIDRKSSMWASFKQAVKLRNDLVHPKEAILLTFKDVQNALLAILEIMNHVFSALYKTSYPAYNRKLDSTSDF